jgi:hypothetical protein
MALPPRAPSAHLCRLCGPPTTSETTICGACERAYGPRVARLLARAERDQDFAAACLRNLPPALAARFASLLGQRCLLPGSDSAQGPGLRAARPRADPKWLAGAN